MPFFEYFFAFKTFFFTDKGALCPSCVDIMKLNLSIVSCQRYVKATLKHIHIDVWPWLDEMLEIMGLVKFLSDFFSYFEVLSSSNFILFLGLLLPAILFLNGSNFIYIVFWNQLILIMMKYTLSVLINLIFLIISLRAYILW
jgi:hypothetical protein